MYNVFLAISIVTELIATTFLKYTEGFTKLWPSVITILAYGICFYCFSRALEHINLSFAYALWSGLGIVVSTMISVFLFKESITFGGLIGIVLIIVGVVILNLCGTSH